MAFSYPLTLPGQLASITITPTSRVGVSPSPFTGQQQIYAHQGKFWRLSASTPTLDRAEAAAWIAWFQKLNGPEGTFLIGDPAQAAPRGSALGAPVVDGASQTGLTLDTRGWTANESGVLLAGDYIQLGTGSSARLHTNLTDVDADASGLATLDIWPQLRESPSDGAPITLTDTVGQFRLAQTQSPWTWRPPTLTEIEFEAVEAI
jgi:hypothetical protein